MDWLGIGVFIVAIAFAVLVIFLIPVLKRLAETLEKSSETIEKSTKSIENITNETTTILHSTNDTILEVNNKLTKLDPLFQIIHDTGESAHHLTSSLVNFTSGKANRGKTTSDTMDRNNFEGIMRGAAFVYYLIQTKKHAK